MSILAVVGFMTALASPSVPATTAGVPAITPDLLGVSTVACIRIGENGAITDAYLARSTGDKERDKHLIAWIRRLRWPAADPGEGGRDVWFPMPLAIGEGVQAPEGPKACGGPETADMGPPTADM